MRARLHSHVRRILPVGVLLFAMSCANRHAPGQNSSDLENPSLAEPTQVQAALGRFVEHALERNRVPPPSVDPGPTTTEAGSLIAGIQLLRAENQEWNHWSDDRTRLFNDAQGYLFELQYQGADGLRWRPESTTLEVNEEDARFTVASTADDCIFPLRIAASEEARHLDQVDLQARWLAATPFRVLYMPTGLLDPSGSGLLFFPAPAESLAPVAMRVRVVWERPDGELLFTTWLLE